ncbi:MAG: cofactor-independent phosphoglycerate mutase, partial [Clostridia bacterium]|nr:cofactor-independent phosphoglycerate mutase [Clostridia bacterium]
MKYFVLLCDGMADTPVEALGGKTPMQAAKKPNMDALAGKSRVGMCRTVAKGLKPGSDVANLSVMGYDPFDCYTGRSPLEAASIGIDLKDTDVTLRCNVVTLSDDEPYENKTMVDYCAGDISTAEAAEIIKTVQAEFGHPPYSFYPGVSYRHCLVVDGGTTDLGNMTPPHDISGRVIGEYLSDSKNAAPLIDLMKKSYELLKCHPVNIEREKRGLRPANSIWLWGEGTKPSIESFKSKFGVNAAVVSAVDLLKGIGKCAGMLVPEVEGATGYIDTNFEGKLNAGINAFKSGCDLVYMHFEAPDECGHRAEPQNKVLSIELIDKLVLAPMLDYLN